MSTQHTQSIETLVNVDTFTLTEILAFTIHYGIFEILACPDKFIKNSWMLPHKNSLQKIETLAHSDTFNKHESLAYCNTFKSNELLL